MSSIFSSIFGSGVLGRNPANLQRSGTMRHVKVDRGSTGRRIRSGSAPGRSPREATEDVAENLVPICTIDPRLEDSQSHSRLPIRAAEHDLPIETNNDGFDVTLELKQAVVLNTNLKEQAQCAEAELTIAVQQRDALRAQLTEYEQREQSKNGELVQAQADIQHLKECLDDCKERIFNMQPLEHMTDSEIADQYRGLCESISDWTDNQFGDCDSPFSRLHMNTGREGPAKLIDEYLVQGQKMKVVYAYPSAGCAMIIFLVHRHLYESILRESICYPGLPAQWEYFVSFITDAMSENEPRRDEDAIRVWLTEVQRALSSSRQVRAGLEAYLTGACSQIAIVLASLLPADQTTPFRGDKLRKIFIEAADLAKNIRISTTTYQFTRDHGNGEPLFMDELRHFKIINQDSAQLIRNSDNIKEGQDGRIGEKLCVVHPALVRKGKNGGRDIILVKATILCNFDRPVTRRKKMKQPTEGAPVAAAQHATTRGDGRT